MPGDSQWRLSSLPSWNHLLIAFRTIPLLVREGWIWQDWDAMPLYLLRVELASTMMMHYDITTLVYVDGSFELEDVAEVYINISEFEGGIGISL